MHIITKENRDVVMIQELYLYQNSPKEITRGLRTYNHGTGKSTAAIMIPNNSIDALLLTKYSDKDILLVIQKGNKSYMLLAYTWTLMRK